MVPTDTADRTTPKSTGILPIDAESKEHALNTPDQTSPPAIPHTKRTAISNGIRCETTVMSWLAAMVTSPRVMAATHPPLSRMIVLTSGVTATLPTV